MVDAIENKCSACLSVSIELLEVLSAERPRNHIDLRHRLDSKGQREGKMIDYRVSELRAYEILDSLCKRLKDYSLLAVSGSKRSWTKNAAEAKKTERLQMVAESQGKELMRWCDRLLEEHEDELSARIRSGRLGLEVDIEEELCRKVTKSCPSNSPSSEDTQASKKETEEEISEETENEL